MQNHLTCIFMRTRIVSQTQEYVHFRCEECGKHLSTSDSLKDHNEQHKEEKSFICQVCKEAGKKKRFYMFATPAAQDQHNDHFHPKDGEETPPENHSCRFCHKVFSSEKGVKAHEKERCPKNEKVLKRKKCLFCSLLIKPSHYNRHMKDKHGHNTN